MMKGGIAGLMKQAQLMQENMKKAQERVRLARRLGEQLREAWWNLPRHRREPALDAWHALSCRMSWDAPSGESRITSYNVCYTKLLRAVAYCRRGEQFLRELIYTGSKKWKARHYAMLNEHKQQQPYVLRAV